MEATQRQNNIIEWFNDIDDWMDRYQLIIDLGGKLEKLPKEYKNEENLIEGCQSRVWLHCYEKDGKIFFLADSDAVITKGLISLLIMVYSGLDAEDILCGKLFLISEIGLNEHLSPTRSNGLNSMIKRIKKYAVESINNR